MYILTHSSLSVSARLLSNKLEELTGKSLGISYGPLSTVPTIRWGSSMGPFENDTRYNSPKGIRIAGNKVAFSTFLDTTDVKFVDINIGIPERHPVVVRQVLNGNSGDGIVIARNEEEFLPYKKFHWAPFYSFEYEVGAHVLGGKLVKLFKKVWEGDGKEPEFPIRNMSKGYGFKRVSFDTSFQKLIPFLAHFHSKFNLEFFRADVGWDKVNKTYRLIEVNTAPSLSNNENTLDLYAGFLAERI